MAQKTSELWDTLFRLPGTRREYGFDVNGTWLGEHDEVSHSVENGLFEEFGIGNATTAHLSLQVFAPEFPRGATIKRYVRLVNGDQQTEWVPKGVFFTNHRSYNDGLWTIEAYDAMRKADTDWEIDPILQFPMSMQAVVDLICEFMDVELDERTQINPAYTMTKPEGDIAFRTVLQYIAAAHGGNWIVTDEGKLRLVPLISIPEETNYLITERGDAITFGGVRILAG